MVPPAPALQVTDEVDAMALRLAGATKAPWRSVIRARIILDAMNGISNEQNARRNGVSPDTVRKRRRRAVSAVHAADAFADAPRSGCPPQISVDLRAAVVKIACSRPTPELAKERLGARAKEAQAARKAARQAIKVAKEKKRNAARQEEAARRAEEGARRARKAARGGSQPPLCQAENDTARDIAKGERQARRAKARVATEELKRAEKDAASAEALISAVAADSARAAKGTVGSFSAVWTQRTVQAEYERETGEKMSISEIGRTLRWAGLRPHRVRVWLHSPDPDFAAKVKRICTLYLEIPPGATLLCVDEKPGMQALEHRFPLHQPEQGETRLEFEYTRHGTATLIAAFNVKTGAVFGRGWRRTGPGLVRFLEALAEEYPKGDVYIVWDNLNVHKGALIDAFHAKQGGRFHFVYTPLHASWVNQVEIWFSVLQRQVLTHGSFVSKADLEAAVMGFITHWNKVARPFRWRFRGDFEPRLLLAS